jgi:hypothetical protein
LWLRGHLQWHDLPTEFHKISTNWFRSSRAGGGRHTHKQKGGLISLRFAFRKESRLKKQAEASLSLEGLRKTTKILIQDTQFPGRDLNPVLSENEERVLNNPTTTFGE